MRAFAFGLAVSVGVVVGNACLLDLDHQIACGDEYVDEAAGEQCDPGDESSYINKCVGTSRPAGDGACDPVSCTIINDRLQCASCGDNIFDPDAGEECEGTTIPVLCPTSGLVACTEECKVDFSQCEKCGNGTVDPGEECDVGDDPGGIAVPRPCAGTADGLVKPLKSPYQDQPYSSGQALGCDENCQFDRTECGYCGNGKLENEGALVSLPSQPMTMSRPEKCDGVNFDAVKLAQEYPCPMESIGNVECSNNCLDFEPRDIGPLCCLPKGADCPAETQMERCCHEWAQPTVTLHCSDPFAPPGEPPDPDGGSKCN